MMIVRKNTVISSLPIGGTADETIFMCHEITLGGAVMPVLIPLLPSDENGIDHIGEATGQKKKPCCETLAWVLGTGRDAVGTALYYGDRAALELSCRPGSLGTCSGSIDSQHQR